MKRIKFPCMVLIAAALVLILSSCDIGKIIKHFEDWIKTTEDGFTYYYNENNDKGVFILDIPDTEELTIPEYIDGKKVVELGHLHSGLGYENRYVVHGENTKKLTVQHQFIAEHDYDKLVDFTNIKTLTFMDFLYCNQTYLEDELIVPYYIGERPNGWNVPTVELKKSDREYSLEDFKAKVIVIPDYVETIEAGVFDGLEGVTIKTSFESQPERWEDGWNGNCEVMWGEEIIYLDYRDWINTTEDGFTYYYNERTDEGVYLLDVPETEEITIPEYINGKKVVKVAHHFEDWTFGVYGLYTKKLTVQHEFDLIADEVCFRYLTTLTFMDYLYCNLSTAKEELEVPCYIGTKYHYDATIFTVELRKSEREYSLENFKPSVIVIPEYVKIIEAGVFDGLTDVTIKTPYESQPEGWEDGWNGSCEVVWGAYQ